MKKLKNLNDFKKFEINETEKNYLTAGYTAEIKKVETGKGTHKTAFCTSGFMTHESDVITYTDGVETNQTYYGVADACQ